MDSWRDSSRSGQFGYEVLSDDVSIPYIIRNDEKVTATKIFQWHLDRQMSGSINETELSDFRYLAGYDMYREEADLLNEINEWHNDNMYPYKFTRNDTLVGMRDVADIFKYFHDCSEKTKHGEQYEMVGGMIQLKFPKTEFVWPYVKRNNKRYIPIDILDMETQRQFSDTVILINIEVMYMKFLYDALKIDITSRKFEMLCVQLDEAVAHLVEDSHSDEKYYLDENYWPTKKITIINFADTKSGGNNNNNEAVQVPIHASAKNSASSKVPVSAKVSTSSPMSASEKVPASLPLPASAPVSVSASVSTSASFFVVAQTNTNEDQRKDEIHEAQGKSRKRSKPKPIPQPPVKKTKTKKKTEATAYFDVEDLIDYKKGKNGKELFLVRWKGYSSKYDSWEPIENLNDSLMEDIEELRKKKAKN